MKDDAIRPTEVRILAAGVDSLYLSARGTFRDELIQTLTDKREEAARSTEAAIVCFREGDGTFLVQPHGWRRYPLWLQGTRVQLFIGASDPFPPVHVMLRSSYLHLFGLERALIEVERLLNDNVFKGSCSLTVSRVDLCADVQGWVPQRDDIDRFVSRAVRRRLFEVPHQLHSAGHELTGMVFGKGPILARLYDKTREMHDREETWPELMWQGYDRSLPVWRVEFQLRSRALRSFGIRSADSLLVGRQDLWYYCTRWLSLRDPSEHSDRSRWPVSPEWEAISAAEMGSPACGLIRERMRAAEELRLIRGFLGYASALAARRGTDDIDEAMRRVIPAAERYLSDRGRTFADVVSEKRRRILP